MQMEKKDKLKRVVQDQLFGLLYLEHLLEIHLAGGGHRKKCG